jgi:hypothetical protein
MPLACDITHPVSRVDLAEINTSVIEETVRAVERAEHKPAPGRVTDRMTVSSKPPVRRGHTQAVARLQSEEGAIIGISFAPSLPGSNVSEVTGAGTGVPRTTAIGVTTYENERLPIRAGDTIGVDDADAQLILSGAGSDTNHRINRWSPFVVDNAPGMNHQQTAPYLLQLNADIEADTDGDGFGDESQDRCPGVPGTVNGCPQADLAVSETAIPNPSPVHGRFSYLVQVRNNGPPSGAWRTGSVYRPRRLLKQAETDYKQHADSGSVQEDGALDQAPLLAVAITNGPPVGEQCRGRRRRYHRVDHLGRQRSKKREKHERNGHDLAVADPGNLIAALLSPLCLIDRLLQFGLSARRSGRVLVFGAVQSHKLRRFLGLGGLCLFAANAP